MKDIEIAKNELKDNITCVLVKDEIIYKSELKGIAPVMKCLNENIDLKGFSVADKVVGRAAAFLFIKAGIKEIYTEIISDGAIQLLNDYNIPFTYNTKVDKIINKTGDDICPMEKTVINVDNHNPEEAYILLNEKIKSLRK